MATLRLSPTDILIYYHKIKLLYSIRAAALNIDRICMPLSKTFLFLFSQIDLYILKFSLPPGVLLIICCTRPL